MIQKTKNYELFKCLKGNRNIMLQKVNNLAESIAIKNLLYLNPIIVNSDMEIIDGQHRFMACKKLDIEVPFIMEDLNLRDVQILNNNKTNWADSDYINSYCQLGNINYINLRNFLKKHNIIMTEIRLFFRTEGNKNSASYTIRSGNLIFNENTELMLLNFLEPHQNQSHTDYP